MEIGLAASLEKYGYLDIPVNPQINLEEEIIRLKKKKNDASN